MNSTFFGKSNFIVLPVWIGYRLCDYSDLHSFSREMMWAHFMCLNPVMFPEYGSGWHETNQVSHKVEKMSDDICSIAEYYSKKRKRLATVFIATGSAVEEVWFPELVYQATKNQNKAYTLIPSSEFNLKCGDQQKESPYSKSELRAHELGALYLHYNTDAPTAGSRRIIEMINRITGADLQGKRFPDYSFEDLKKMAWHVSRESFNSMGKAQGTIEKYPIINGRPSFSVL